MSEQAKESAKSFVQEIREQETQLRQRVENRLKEIKEQIGPLQSEEAELHAFLSTEEEEAPKPKQRSSAPKRERRSRKGGTRAEQALDFLQKRENGATVAEVAEAMKINSNYLYRVMNELAEDGRVTKDGHNYVAVSA